jgi:hypothetical protein
MECGLASGLDSVQRNISAMNRPFKQIFVQSWSLCVFLNPVELFLTYFPKVGLCYLYAICMFVNASY